MKKKFTSSKEKSRYYYQLYRKNNPDYALLKKEKRLKRLYGISLDQYNMILEAQDFCCDICNDKLELTNYKAVHLDHCHTTGIIRGILCGSCNRGLGAFRDSAAYLKAAFKYLGRNNACSVD